MNALVLGGTRFIGRRLVEALLEAGRRVTLFNRGTTPDPFGGAVTRIRGDRRRPGDLAAAVRGRDMDVVYDFVCYDAADAEAVLHVLPGSAGRYVLISTCSVYWCTGRFPCPVPEEEFDRHGEFAERPGSIEYAYGYGKRQAERAAFDAHREGRLVVTSVRMPIVGGEGDPSLRYASYVRRIQDGRPLILPDGGLAPFRHVYVGDAARALADLPGRVSSGGQAYNLAGDEILTERAVVEAIAELVGRRLETVDVPARILPRLGIPGPGVPFAPFSQQAAQVPAIHKARRELDWRPTPHEVWLERAVRWATDPEGGGRGSPEAYARRDLEVEAVARYRNLMLSSGGEAGTSGEHPE